MYLIILAGLLGAGVLVFNRLVKAKFLMQEAYSGIDVQLKRRHELIPNIVEAVKGYMQHERRLLEDVTRLRAQVVGAGQKEKPGLENQLSQGLKSLFAVVENYPDLKADQSFLKLQETLIEIEDQLQMARRYYNGTVRNYNIAAQSFPANIVAGLFNFKPAEFFEIEYATERKVPDIKIVT